MGIIDVDAIIDSNKGDMEIMATIPFVGTLYLLHQAYSSQSGAKRAERERKRELRFLFRSIFSILIKFDECDSSNDRQQHLEHEEEGLVMLLIYKCFLWEQQQTAAQMTREDRIWFSYDLNHFISRRFTAKQGIALLNRM